MEGLDPEGMAPENALILHTPVVWDSGFLPGYRQGFWPTDGSGG